MFKCLLKPKYNYDIDALDGLSQREKIDLMSKDIFNHETQLKNLRDTITSFDLAKLTEHVEKFYDKVDKLSRDVNILDKLMSSPDEEVEGLVDEIELLKKETSGLSGKLDHLSDLFATLNQSVDISFANIKVVSRELDNLEEKMNSNSDTFTHEMDTLRSSTERSCNWVLTETEKKVQKLEDESISKLHMHVDEVTALNNVIIDELSILNNRLLRDEIFLAIIVGAFFVMAMIFKPY